jgi:3-keto-5-aminohexanoate cleavage enzyme
MAPSSATIINFCPTGMVPTKEHTPHVPISTAEVIEEVHQANELGITIAHLHARLADGKPDWRKDNYGRILEGVRKHCPQLVVCFSTSGRSVSEFEKRSAVIELLPDMCSLTLSSLNFGKNASLNPPDIIQRLALKMKDHGVKPELECFDLGMINYGRYLIGKGIVEGPCYWNLLFGNIAGMQPRPAHIGAAVADIPKEGVHYVAFGGIGGAQAIANRYAIEMGYGVRTGIEDNIWFDKGRTRLASNMDLLRRVHELMSRHQRSLFTSVAFGESGFHHAHQSARVH